MELKGTVALVTGGATGIGRAICLELAAKGAEAVVVNYSRSEEEAESTAQEVRRRGAQAHVRRADVAADLECRQLVEEVVARFGRLDVVVNNAGTTRHIPHADLEALTPEVWNEIMGVNLHGTLQVSRAAASALRATRGAIVNVSSIAGVRAAGSSIAYGASKAAINQLTRSLAAALAPDVRVNAVLPGLVATRWFRRPFGDDVAQAQEEFMAAVTPAREVTAPEHVAQAVVGLLGMDMVTGETLVVDGGLHLLYGPSAPERRTG